MNWVQKLISIDAPEHASLHSASLSLRSSFPWWAAGLVLVAVGLGVSWLYARESGRFGRVRRLIMTVLRGASIALLLLLLLRPVLIAEYVGERPRGVALLIDNSQSMTQRDRRLTPQDRIRVAIAEDLVAADTPVTDNLSLGSIPEGTLRDPDRASVVRAVLTNARLQLADGLAGRGPLRTYLFGQRLRNATGEAGIDRTEMSATDHVLAAPYVALNVATMNAVGLDGAKALAESPLGQQLLFLDLEYNRDLEEHGKALVRMFPNAHVQVPEHRDD